MMNRIVNVLLSGIFVQAGYGAATQPGGRTKAAQKFFADLGIELTDEQAELLVRANGGLMVGAGATLALGILPRLSALTLIASLVPTTLAGHAFWKADEASRTPQLTQFMKNVAITGGLICSAFAKKK